jgi:hypothetical protein
MVGEEVDSMIATPLPMYRGRVWVMLRQCAWCGGIKLGNWRLALPGRRVVRWAWQLHLPHFGPLILGTSHGLCPECAQKVRARPRRTQPA